MDIQNRTDPAKKPETPLLRDYLHALKYYLGRRRVLVPAAMAIVGGGLLLNWNWLVAAGVAPLLLIVLPCGAMCALGMCMKHRKGGADGTGGHGSAGHDDGDETDHTRRP